jgi:transposase
MRSSKSGRRYSQQFQTEAVERLLAGDYTVNQLAVELDVSPHTLQRWKDLYLKAAGAIQRDGKPVAAKQLEQELRGLRKEVQALRRQRDILKKALGVLSEGPLPNGMP